MYIGSAYLNFFSENYLVQNSSHNPRQMFKILRSCSRSVRQVMPTICNTDTMGSRHTSKRKYKASDLMDIEINRMVWIDLEMTGLDVDTDKIMEIACIVTDADLNIVAEGPSIALHQPTALLQNMNSWCKTQHAKTGLTQACIESQVTLKEAEEEVLHFVKQHVTENASPLAGNSVYMDRLFLRKYMPKLNDYLHYRIVDVSTIKELCRRWHPKVYKGIPKKDFSHRALSDIRESIEELKFYREHFFRVGQC